MLCRPCLPPHNALQADAAKPGVSFFCCCALRPSAYFLSRFRALRLAPVSPGLHLLLPIWFCIGFQFGKEATQSPSCGPAIFMSPGLELLVSIRLEFAPATNTPFDRHPVESCTPARARTHPKLPCFDLGGLVWRQPEFDGEGGWEVSRRAAFAISRPGTPTTQISGRSVLKLGTDLDWGILSLGVDRNRSGIGQLRRK